MNKFIVGILLILVGGFMGACEKTEDDKDKKEEPVFSHAAFDAMLSQHVNAVGDVDYMAFLDDTTDLKDYLDYLAENEP